MKCKNCEINESTKYSKYSSGDFCSKECAKSFSTKEKRKEINKIVSEKLKGSKYPNRKKTIEKRKNEGKSRSKYLDISFEEKWGIINNERRKKRREKLLDEDYKNLKFDRLRERIIIEQNDKCNKCKNDKWLGFDITLELEHIDGNNKNNERENLEALCPNCHSLTSTWRGRNKKNCNRGKIDDEKLLRTLIEHNFNMRQSLLSVGLAAKGGNYKRCHQLKREYIEVNMGV